MMSEFFLPIGFLAFWSPGPVEMMLLAAVALLLYGGNLPNVARSWGKSLSEFRRGLSGIQNELNDVIYGEPERLEYHQETSSPYVASAEATDTEVTEVEVTDTGGFDSEVSDSEVSDSEGLNNEVSDSEEPNNDLSDSEGPDSHGPDSGGPDSNLSPTHQDGLEMGEGDVTEDVTAGENPPDTEGPDTKKTATPSSIRPPGQ